MEREKISRRAFLRFAGFVVTGAALAACAPPAAAPPPAASDAASAATEPAETGGEVVIAVGVWALGYFKEIIIQKESGAEDGSRQSIFPSQGDVRNAVQGKPWL